MDQTQTKTESVAKAAEPITVFPETSENEFHAASTEATPPRQEPPRQEPPRGMRKLRFVFGMLLTGSGIALILSVAAGAVQAFGVTGRLSLPAVGLCMIVGVMCLGGGFGVMATSAATFENDEFERLMADNRPSRRSTSV